MPVATDKNRVTVHLKIDRPVRQEVVGNLHRHGTTMQDFYEQIMKALAEDSSAFSEIQRQAAEKTSERTRRLADERSRRFSRVD